MKRDYRALALLVLLVGLTVFPVLAGRFYASGDMRDVFIPLETFFHTEVLAGRLPAWNQNSAWGFPVIASAQIGFFYPPLLLIRWLPVWLYLPFILVTHVIGSAWGMYWFLKQRHSQAAAILGSICFSLSSFGLQHLTHLNIMLVIAWLPWQFLLAERYARRESFQLPHGAALALILGMPFLAGQVQLPLLMAMVVSCYFLWRRWQAVGWQWRTTGIIVGLTVVVIALASAQLFPTAELARYSSRGSAGTFDVIRANQHSFPLYHLPTVVFPRFFGHDDTYWGKRLEIEYGIFIGTIPLLLSWWVLKKRPGVDSFWLGLTLLSFLLSLGTWSPFRLVGFEPSLWFFSAPARWLLFTTFGLAVLAARGLDMVRTDPKPFITFARVIATIFIGGVLVFNLLIFVYPQVMTTSVTTLQAHLPANYFNKPPEYYTEKVEQLRESATLSSVSFKSWYTLLPLLALLVAAASAQPRFLTTVTAVELIIIGATISPTLPWKAILTPPASLAALPPLVREQQARLISVREDGDTGAVFTNPESRANAAKRQQQRELLLPLMHTQFNIAGVEWPASLDLQKQEEVLGQLRTDNSYTIDNNALAEQLNIGAIVVPNQLPQPTSLPLHATVNNVSIYSVEAQPRATLRQSQNPVSYTALNPAHTQITVQTDHADELVVRDTWYPGWVATVNGKPVKITATDGFFRSIALPAGEHRVDMRFVSLPLYSGMALSALTSVFCLILLYKGKSLL